MQWMLCVCVFVSSPWQSMRKRLRSAWWQVRCGVAVVEPFCHNLVSLVKINGLAILPQYFKGLNAAVFVCAFLSHSMCECVPYPCADCFSASPLSQHLHLHQHLHQHLRLRQRQHLHVCLEQQHPRQRGQLLPHLSCVDQWRPQQVLLAPGQVACLPLPRRVPRPPPQTPRSHCSLMVTCWTSQPASSPTSAIVRPLPLTRVASPTTCSRDIPTPTCTWSRFPLSQQYSVLAPPRRIEAACFSVELYLPPSLRAALPQVCQASVRLGAWDGASGSQSAWVQRSWCPEPVLPGGAGLPWRPRGLNWGPRRVRCPHLQQSIHHALVNQSHHARLEASLQIDPGLCPLVLHRP
jgi:hypothetical protein